MSPFAPTDLGHGVEIGQCQVVGQNEIAGLGAYKRGRQSFKRHRLILASTQRTEEQTTSTIRIGAPDQDNHATRRKPTASSIMMHLLPWYGLGLLTRSCMSSAEEKGRGRGTGSNSFLFTPNPHLPITLLSRFCVPHSATSNES